MRSLLLFGGSALLAIALAGCTASPRFTFEKPTEVMDENYTDEGVASYYAEEFNGKMTSSGEQYDMNAMTAAHRTLPFNTRVRVTNQTNGKSVVVRINDRGPFKDDRLIDLSYAAAKQLELVGSGTATVKIKVVELGNGPASSK